MWDLIVSVPDHCLSFYFEDAEKALESEFGLFPTTTNVGGYLYQWWPMATDPLKYMIPIGTNGNQATIGDQW